MAWHQRFSPEALDKPPPPHREMLPTGLYKGDSKNCISCILQCLYLYQFEYFHRLPETWSLFSSLFQEVFNWLLFDGKPEAFAVCFSPFLPCDIRCYKYSCTSKLSKKYLQKVFKLLAKSFIHSINCRTKKTSLKIVKLRSVHGETQKFRSVLLRKRNTGVCVHTGKLQIQWFSSRNLNVIKVDKKSVHFPSEQAELIRKTGG